MQETSSPVVVVGQFSCFVIPGEDMVIVVPTFTESNSRYEDIVNGTNVLVIGFHAIEVSSTVNQPGTMQRQTVTEHGTNKEADLKGRAQVIVREESGQNEAADGHNNEVVSTIKNFFNNLKNRF